MIHSASLARRELAVNRGPLFAYAFNMMSISGREVVQFLYGEDGMDGVWVEKQNFDILLMGRKQFKQAYEIDVNSPKFGYSSVPGQRYLTRDVRVGEGRGSEALFYLF